MKNKKRWLALGLAAVTALSVFAGCGKKEAKDDKGSVYYLNFKPEAAKTWEKIAKKYTEETGVEVKVVTAAAGTYEQTLKSEVAKKNPPTLFQINGPVGYQNWKAYTADLKDTKLYSWLLDQDMAVKDGEGVYGIPFAEEGYGIIYNDEIMQKYFALSDKAVDISSTEEINSFDKLKAVVEDMTAKKDQLGIEGVFASTSLKPGEDWRWQTHLMNLPLNAEYKDKDETNPDKIDFTYNKEYKQIFDLYLNNSVTEAKLLSSKSVDDSMSEFALGKVAMVQNGNWGWGQISGVDGNTVKEESVKFLPIYIGLEGEENQGLCIGTENYMCVNAKVSEADQKATIAFMEWLFNSDEGKAFVTKDLGFIAPFNTFSDEEKPTDPLAKEILKYMADENKANVPWNFTTMPSQTWKDDFGASLLEYAQGSKEWDKVVSDMTEEWATEKANAQ
ncbi:ABC transporter substrate-binding protein [Suipraeoptans intestinalis]|uniref:ABC transporter substrate-binding protein n=1 Tax=Suipraeoptans intestinalis TaxID=2606628 RepID=UPI0023F04134|nr:ABC transporter substrate-binding protein [Suipraeoptans intestinalis]MDD7770024.1 ABC transporter substrate-binding protein [Suipraeoptans intestinalis]MDY3121062.1 ABC transporter substrate-binding protein [Suipraeoptans intestinalis]